MNRAGWNFENSLRNESALRPLCEQVNKHFPVPSDRHYRYFATSPDLHLTEEIGQYYRGLHVATTASCDLSRYILNRYLPAGATNYDHLIYIRDITCADPTGCVVTYAHELQHIVQYVHPKLTKVNQTLYGVLKTFEPAATEIDLPSEADANIVSKRVAEEVCGIDAVRRFGEERVCFMLKTGDRDQIIRWNFFVNTPSSTAYDFEKETLKLVEKFSGRVPFGMDISQPDWWKGAIDEFPPGSY
jgi:hypothetical protein